MLSIDDIEQLIPVLKRSNEWGKYYTGKFYFTIATGLERYKAGLIDNTNELNPQAQLALQWKHFPALFHEYIHYLHELSTVIGNAGMALNLVEKVAFTHALSTDPKSCVSNGISIPDHVSKYAKSVTTEMVLFGDSLEVLNGGKLVKIFSFVGRDKEVWFPEGNDFQRGNVSVPHICFSYYDGELRENGEMDFGKYFIYEGLAYELDRIVEKNVLGKDEIDDTLKGTEYTVLRSVAKYIFEGVETRSFLTLASLSLQHIDCGNSFIAMINRVKANAELDILQEATVAEIQEETRLMLVRMLPDFLDAQDEIKESYKNRPSLYKSYEFITDQIKNLYQIRTTTPAFEVDLVFENRHSEILEKANICNYMYLFTDEKEFMRDFLGTSMDKQTSNDLMVLLAGADYFTAHRFFSTNKIEQQGNHICPFYYTCDLEFRMINHETCKNRPWRSYEISVNSDGMHCWYGQAVGESKGHTRYR